MKQDLVANPHRNPELLRAYGLGQVDARAADTVAGHLETCTECRRVVATTPADRFLSQLQEVGGSTGHAAGTEESQADQTGPVSRVPPGVRAEADSPLPFNGSAEQPGAAIPAALASNPEYEVVRELNRGGMGVVYLVRNRRMDRLEGLKVVNGALLKRAGALERFEREMRSAARLNHPNIVRAFSAPRLDGVLAFAMEYVDGIDLHQLVKARGALPVSNACYYVYQAAQGLQHAHERQMVHRDIKPNNLMLTRDGNKQIIKILDFGLAKATSENPIDGGLTGTGQMLGTPQYMAPEQILNAAKADIRADIYSLGCTLYYLLAGRAPFRDKGSLYETLRAHHCEQPPPLNEVQPDVPAELAAIVAKMMAKDGGQRYQQPVEVAQALAPFFKRGVKPMPVVQDAVRPPPAQKLPESAADVPVDSSGSEAVPAWQAVHQRAIDPGPAPPAAPLDGRRRWRVRGRIETLRLWSIVVTSVLAAGALAAWAAGVFDWRAKDGMPVAEVSEPHVEKQPAPPVQGFIPLFNGADLTGWRLEGSKTTTVTIADGVLTAINSGPKDYIDHLVTERTDFVDFHLRCQVMPSAGQPPPSIMARVDPSAIVFGGMRGYQFGLPAKGSAAGGTGSTAASLSLGSRVRGTFELAKTAHESLADETWHSVELIVIGNRLQMLLDGKIVLDHMDDGETFRRGAVALLLPDGVTSRFRNVEICELPTTSEREPGKETRTRWKHQAVVGNEWNERWGVFQRVKGKEWIESITHHPAFLRFWFSEVDRTDDYVELERPATPDKIIVRLYKTHAEIGASRDQMKVLYSGGWED